MMVLPNLSQRRSSVYGILVRASEMKRDFIFEIYANSLVSQC
jgi:hypothetical protein